MEQAAQTILDDEAAAQNYPGMVFGVSTPTCGAVVVVWGNAVVEPVTPMHGEHIMSIASVTKTFVAAVVLQLVKEGVLSLEDNLSTWFPQVENSSSITIRQLLNHTSGVFDYAGDPECWDREIARTPEELLACALNNPPYFPPGTGWECSNTNYLLAGRIVELETGAALHEQISERLLVPQALGRPGFLGAPPPGDLAHVHDSDVDITGLWHHSNLFGGGFMVSAALDLLAWIRVLLEGNVLPIPMLQEMLKFEDTRGWFGNEVNYGLGLAQLMAPSADGGADIELWGHGGAGEAQSELFWMPDRRWAAVQLINHLYDTPLEVSIPRFAAMVANLVAQFPEGSGL